MFVFSLNALIYYAKETENGIQMKLIVIVTVLLALVLWTVERTPNSAAILQLVTLICLVETGMEKCNK